MLWGSRWAVATGNHSFRSAAYLDGDGAGAAFCQGGTRKKIERSSGAIVQYVGQAAFCQLWPCLSGLQVFRCTRTCIMPHASSPLA